MTTLYDAHGQPIDMSLLGQELSGVTVTGVRSPLSGHPAQNLNPIRLARLLRAAEEGDALSYLELAEEMEEKDCHYRSVLATRKMQVSGLDIVVESPSDNAGDIKATDLVRDFIATDVLQHSLFDILDAVGKGFSACEILWDCEGKTWAPSRIVWRDPRWFVFDPLDGVTLRLKDETGTLTPLAPAKFISHSHKSKSGLPIRGGLARAACWGYLFKNFDIKAWMIFCEVYGHPLRLGRYGPSSSKDDRDVLLRAVRNVASDHAAIIPESMRMEFIDAKAQGNAQVFEKLAEYLDRQVSKLVLGQTGTTDTGSRVGTANAHEHVRQDIETADALQLSATLNRDLVRPLVDLNLGPQKRYPRIKIFRPDAEDVSALISNVVKLVPLGLRVESSVLADKLGLPDPDAGAVVLTPDATALSMPDGDRAAAPTTVAGATPPKSKATASVQTHTPQNTPQNGSQDWPQDGPQDDIDLYVAAELDGWQPLVQPLVDPVTALLNDCQSYEEFAARLPELIAGQDVTPLAQSLAKALFIAQFEAETKP